MSDLATAMHRIPWHTIRKLGGFCDSIPSAVLSLTSADRTVRQDAYWQIDNHVVVQGGLYEGAFYVSPFLIQICASDSSHGKEEALDLLVEIANGATLFSKSIDFELVDVPFLHFLPRGYGYGVPLMVACRFAIASSLDSLMQCVTSDDALARRNAGDLLTSFPEYHFVYQGYLENLFAEKQLGESILNDVKKIYREMRTLT